MNSYEKTVYKDLKDWHHQMRKKPSVMNKVTKFAQTKVQQLIPAKAQEIITASVKTMAQTIMLGSGALVGNKETEKMSLAESDFLVEKAFTTYDKTAIVQGFGFGLGGILMGLADFPALMSIKMKFLFDCAKFYGYDANKESERLFLLYVFQIAFSSDEHRQKIYSQILNWDKREHGSLDWEKFQTEYRDYIDLVKMMQLLPIVGSVVGSVANHSLLGKLKTTAMNCYRNRYFENLN